MPDDVPFWSRQLCEHALFLSLMLEDPALRDEAASLHQSWLETCQSGADVTGPLAALISLKERVLARQLSGEWLGWALPSFVAHILFEARYFQARISRGTTRDEDVQTWIRVVKDHADVGPKLLDPAAPGKLVSTAASLSGELERLQRRCSGSPYGLCLADADRYFMAANAWVDAVPPRLSIIPETLASHIKRENSRGQLTVRLYEGRR